MDKRLLLAIQYVANERAIVLPWDTIGEHLGVTSGAISQHLAKLRHRLVEWGFSVPPPLRRGGNNAIQGPKSRVTASRRSNARKDYESDEYENEYEEPDWKEDEYGEEESDVQMTEVQAIKKSGGKADAEDNGDSDEDVKPRIRVQLRQYVDRKRACTEDDESYASPTGMGEQGHSRRRSHIEATIEAQETRASRSSRVISSSERSVSSDVEMRDVGDGSKLLKRADVGEMFSEFSRPARVSKAGPPKVTSMSADPTYGLFRQQTDRMYPTQDDKIPYNARDNAEPGDVYSRETGNTLFVDQGNGNPYNAQDNLREPRDRFAREAEDSFFSRQDDGNLHNAHSVSQPRHRLPREAGGGLFVKQSGSQYNTRDSTERADGLPKGAESGPSINQSTLVQQALSITSPAHAASPPATPKNKILQNPYANGTVATHGPSSVGSMLSDRGQNTAPIARVTMQHPRNVTGIVSNFLSQPNDLLLDEPLYPTLYPYPQSGTFDSSGNEVKQEHMHGSSKTPGLQSHSSDERRQYDGLPVPSQEVVVSFPGLDFDFDAFFNPNGLGDATDDFDGTF
ncbi:MAG: hypothetical protein M1840_000015 [Geoglossum simile]|nr:MAG: hypothetical protein M1840_000015 [Geoglossum simile]